MKQKLNHTMEYARFVGRRFVEDRCLMVAGSLAYTSLLALVPLFAVTIALTAQIPQVRDFILQVKDFILKNLLPEVGGRIMGVYMEEFAQNAAHLKLIGLVLIFVAAIALMFTIDGAFNHIWRAKQRRNWWKRLAAYLSVLTLGPLLIGASLTVTSYVVHWTRKFDRVLPLLDDGLLIVIPFAFTAAALILAYRAIPNRYVPTRHAIFGGVFAAILFELVKHLFVAYIVRVPTYNLVYGTFASVPIFLLWLFCCWVVALIGAEVTATLSYFGHAPAPRSTRKQLPSLRVREAEQIVNALAASPVPLAFNALRLRASMPLTMPIDIAEDILHDLVAAGIVVNAPGGYTLVTAPVDIRDEDIRAAVGADYSGS